MTFVYHELWLFEVFSVRCYVKQIPSLKYRCSSCRKPVFVPCHVSLQELSEAIFPCFQFFLAALVASHGNPSTVLQVTNITPLGLLSSSSFLHPCLKWVCLFSSLTGVYSKKKQIFLFLNVTGFQLSERIWCPWMWRAKCRRARTPSSSSLASFFPCLQGSTQTAFYFWLLH